MAVVHLLALLLLAAFALVLAVVNAEDEPRRLRAGGLCHRYNAIFSHSIIIIFFLNIS